MCLLPTLVLADYTGIWEMTEVFSCNLSKTFNWTSFMPTVFGSPRPKNFSTSAHEYSCRSHLIYCILNIEE